MTKEPNKEAWRSRSDHMNVAAAFKPPNRSIIDTMRRVVTRELFNLVFKRHYATRGALAALIPWDEIPRLNSSHRYAMNWESVFLTLVRWLFHPTPTGLRLILGFWTPNLFTSSLRDGSETSDLGLWTLDLGLFDSSLP